MNNINRLLLLFLIYFGSVLTELKEGMTFAFNGFRAWKLKTDGIKIVSVEDIAIVTSDGATYLIESQEELILILNR